MFDIRFNSIHAKPACFLLLICFAVAVVAAATTRRVQANTSIIANSRAQTLSTPVQSNEKVNGKIVFSSDRRRDFNFTIWTMNPDGSNPTQLTDIPASSTYVYDINPRFSPDGTMIAFRSYGRGSYHSLFVMNADSSDLQEVVINSSPEIGGFDWSPDGTKFLFDAGSYVEIASTPAASNKVWPSGLQANLYVVGIDGKNLVRLTSDDEVMNVSASWSPDGKMIAFQSRPAHGPDPSKVQVMNSDGTSRHVVAIGSNPSWSPDGSRILFVGPGNTDPCYNGSCQELYTVAADGSNSEQLTHYSGSYIDPRYSPDGTKISFGRHLETYYVVRDFPFGRTHYSDEGYAVFMMDANGSHQTNVSNRLETVSPYDNEPNWQRLDDLRKDPPVSVLSLNADLYLVRSSQIQITVNRGSNFSQAVSCDYVVQSDGRTSSGLPQGTISFAPGEISKTIEFSLWLSPASTYYIHLFHNTGNATLVGGIKDALLSIVSSSTIDNIDFFVRQHYEDFLNRDPDEAGWRFWNITLYTCGTRGAGAACYQSRRPEVSAAFFLSTEFRETGYLVYRIYRAAYGNIPGGPVPIKFNEFLPDTREIGHGVIVNEGNWEPQLEANKQAFFSEFVQRSRFTVAYPTFMTPVQFVDRLFANAGVIPSVSERESAIGEFNGATGSADSAARARALRRVAENAKLQQQEFNRAFVLMQYFGYLRRDPNSGPDGNFDGYHFWLNKLNQFNGDYNKAEMVKAFISSGEYRQRFGP